MDLPRTSEEIARWLGKPDDKNKIAGIREWHGEAALVAAMERVAELPVELRARAFFDHIGAGQAVREMAGFWPSISFKRWRAGG